MSIPVKLLTAVAACLFLARPAEATGEFTVFPKARPTVALSCAGHGWAAAAGDADGDGKLDLLASGPGGLSLMMGKGEGRFTPCKQLDNEPASSIFLADFDGDGTADLLTAEVRSDGSNGMRFLKGLGQGVFAAGVTIPLPDLSSGALAVNDVNGDGKADVITTSWRIAGGARLATITTYFGSPGGFDTGPSFDLPLIPANAGGSPIKSLTAWRNPKGALELIVSREPGVVDTFVVDSLGHIRLSSSQTTLFGSLFADFNNDGYLDAIRAGLGDVTISFGSENGWLPRTSLSPGLARFSIAADLNGDGYPDLIGIDSGTITISLNGGGTALKPAVVYFASGGFDRVVVGDFSGGGHADIVVDSTGPGEQTVMMMTIRGSGDGTIDAPIVFPFDAYGSPPRSPLLTFTADFNHDGRPDIGVVTQSACCTTFDAPTIQILLNRSAGVFEPLPVVIPGGAQLSINENSFVFARAGDFDGDANIDIAIQQADGASDAVNSVFFGAGDGTFLETRPPLPAGYLLGAEDLFKEGADNLLLGNFGLLTIAGFTHERKLRPAVEWPLLPGVFGDVNGDGLIDLYSPSFLVPHELLINGGRSLIRGSELRRLQVESNGNGLADFDGDGILDLVTFSASPESVVFMGIQSGGGDNTFRFPAYFGHGAQLPLTPAGATLTSDTFLDWDGDGHIDIVSQKSILFNRGGLQFERAGQLLSAKIVASADFDGDGHRDAVVATQEGICVLMARTATAGEEPSIVTIDITPTRLVTPRVVSAAGVPTGTVDFREGDRIVASAEVGGTALLPLAAGAHGITAVYSGDGVFARNTAEFTVDVPKSQISVGLQFGGNVSAVPGLLSAVLGTGKEVFEPHGTVTFRDVDRGTVLAAVAAESITSVALDLGAAARTIEAAYSGDINFFPAVSNRYSYSPVAVPVSVRDSRLTVVPTGQGYNIEVQLLGAGGQPLQIEPSNPPRINISASRGTPDFPSYRGDGRYTSFLNISRSAAEQITISARVTAELIGSVSIGPSLPRSRAARK